MVATREEEDTEYLLAKTTLDLIATKKRNEQFKNILIKTFGTFDIDKIKKMQNLESNS